MILPGYHIGPSYLAGAGTGLFFDEPVAGGCLLALARDIRGVHRRDDPMATPIRHPSLAASARRFDKRDSDSLESPGEHCVNDAFAASEPGHLGSIFAMHELHAGSEITVDHRPLLAPGQEEEFRDAQTGLPIIGLSWQESLSTSTATLATLLG